VKADHGASQDKPGEVNIGAALIADAQTPDPNISHQGINIGGVSAVNCYGSLCYEQTP
jgi:hypothetical protein